MRTLIIVVMLLIIAVVFCSCNGFLSKVEPSSQLDIKEVFRTADDLEAALVGAYDAIQNGSLLGRNTLLLPELLSSNVVYQSGAFTKVAFFQMSPTDNYVMELWNQSYKTINHLNAILASLGPVEAQDATLGQADAARIKGETLLLRGVVYFEMLRLFCQPIGSRKHQELGLPLMLEPVLSQEQLQFLARNSIAEVYEQITIDIERARNLLSEFIGVHRVNKYVAIAYLARIAFQREDYTKAAALSGELIQSQSYSLVDTPQEYFITEASKEDIWSIHSAPGDEIDGFGLSSIYHETGPNEALISSDLRKNGYEAVVTLPQAVRILSAGFEVVDLRADPGLLSTDLLISSDTVLTNKYENSWLENKDEAPVARLAEFLLMRAEALVRIEGMNQESLDLLNQVRRRSIRIVDDKLEEVPIAGDLVSFGLDGFIAPEDFIEAIILERRVELAFEGNRFHDLMRLKRSVKGLPFDAPALRLPLPQRDIDANVNLVQNPGY